MGQQEGALAGVLWLEDFGANLSRDEIAGYLAEFGGRTGVDASSRRLAAATGGQMDLSLAAHRLALITWLRAWGCRHLRRVDTPLTDEALRAWWETWGRTLPDISATLTGLGEAGLAAAGQTYEALRTAPAATRNTKGQQIGVAFGDTAAAKAMFAIRPLAFLPWDESIRLAFARHGGGDAYVRLLRLSASALDGLARRLGVDVAGLPVALGRPEATPPKLVDEFLLVRVFRTRPPSQVPRGRDE